MTRRPECQRKRSPACSYARLDEYPFAHVRTRGARRLAIWSGWPDSWRLTGEANRSKEAQGKFAPSDLRTRFRSPQRTTTGAAMLPRLNADASAKVDIQETDFSHDLFGRFVCSTWDEVVNNGGAPFDAVVIGAGMFGRACAGELYRF